MRFGATLVSTARWGQLCSRRSHAGDRLQHLRRRVRPDVWSKVHDEGTQVLENIANIRAPMIWALEGRAHVHIERDDSRPSACSTAISLAETALDRR